MLKTQPMRYTTTGREESRRCLNHCSMLRRPLPMLLVLSLFVLITTRCAIPQPGKGSVDSAAPGTVLFSDDFSKTPNGWGTWTRDGASVEYHNGGLRILVNETQFDFWSVAGQKFADATIEVDALKIGGPDDNDFGLICRYQDKDNFYMLMASSDGYYGIAKMKEGLYSMIGTDQLQYSSAIGQGKLPNQVRADCIGTTLRLHVNGETLMETEDSDFASGDVGVIAGSYDTQGVDILFDNFVVKKP